MLGGNANRRGPVWLPLSFVLLLTLRHFSQPYGGALAPVDKL